MIEIQHMGKGCRIHNDVVIEHPDKLVIGDNVHIHRGAFIDAVGSVTIGAGAVIGLGVVVARDVPPRAIVVVPDFKIIGYRDTEKYDLLNTTGQYGGVGGGRLAGDQT